MSNIFINIIIIFYIFQNKIFFIQMQKFVSIIMNIDIHNFFIIYKNRDS